MKTKLKIGGFTWDYNELEEVNEGRNMGSSTFETLKIEIQKDLKKDVKKSTILHELFHSFFSSSGYSFKSSKEEDDTVDILAMSMLQFLKDNPKFFKDNILK